MEPTNINDLFTEINETIFQLSKQQQICTSLSMLLSHISDNIGDSIDSEYSEALEGSIYMLDTVTQSLLSLYSQLDESATLCRKKTKSATAPVAN